MFGNKSTLDESQVPKKGFFARLKYRLEQMKAKHIEEEKAEEEAERLDEEEKQKNKELKKAAATEKKEQKKQAGEAKKAQKANKPKKVKPKKVKKPKEPPKPQDILKIKPVSIVMLVLFVAAPYNEELSKKSFQMAYAYFKKALDVRRSGSAAIDLCSIAAGRAELYFELRLSPWDFAAGALIVEEAGGVVTTVEGGAVTLGQKCSVLATNGRCGRLE